MATTEDVREALLERMKDPTLNADVFNEMLRRLKSLDSEG
jgi:hypothetical protein